MLLLSLLPLLQTGLPDKRVLYEYLPLWKELVCVQDRVTRLVLQAAIDTNSFGTVLARPVGTTQAEEEMAMGIVDTTAVQSLQPMDVGDAAQAGTEAGGRSQRAKGAGAGAGAGAGGSTDDSGGGGSGSIEDNEINAEADGGDDGLWLLDDPTTPLSVAVGAVSGRLYDEVMKCIMRVLGDVDLSVKFSASDVDMGARAGAGVGAGAGAGSRSGAASAGAAAALDDVYVGDVQLLANLGVSDFRPRVEKDFELFLNLVEFAVYFISMCPHRLFRPWAYVFCKQVVGLSNRYPHISGFYKLINVAMYVCDTSKYFAGLRWCDGRAEVAATGADGDTEMADAVDANRVYCFRLVSKFAEEVSVSARVCVCGGIWRGCELVVLRCQVSSRVRQYKDELLMACIRFLLGLPVELSGKQILGPSLTAALALGACLRGVDSVPCLAPCTPSACVTGEASVLTSL